MLTVFVVLTLIGVAAAVAALVTLHVLPTGLSPVRDAVSAYGISRHRRLYRVQTVATAVAAASLAAALLVAPLGAVTPAVITLIVLAAARTPIGWVPMDADGSPQTAVGRRHNLLAYAAFAAASVGGFMTGIAFAGVDGLGSAATAVTVLGWVMTGASVLTVAAAVVPAMRRLFGLFERIIYLGMFTWLTVSAVVLLGA